MSKRIAILALVAVSMVGCVKRQLEVSSEPPGAIVYISDIEVGRTPVVVPFTYYGDRDIILRMDGYETLVTNLKLTTPWYEYPGIDFFSEIAPWTYDDHRYIHYQLEPKVATSREELIERADEMGRLVNEPVNK